MTAAAPKQKSKKLLLWAAAAVALAVAVIAAAAIYLRRTPPPAEKQAVRFTVGPPEKGSFTLGFTNDSAMAVSPDGSKMVFVAAAGSSGPQLWVRALDSQSAQALPGTENAVAPFWSPDGRFIAFSADGKLKKIALSGGSVESLAEVRPTGAGWSRGGVILFKANDGTLNRVSESGEAVTPVTTLDTSRSETAHLWPEFLPDGRHFLYFAESSKAGNDAIFVSSLDSKERKLLLSASSNCVYVSPGYLLFNRQGTLMAQPFDDDRLQLTGDAVPIAEGVEFNLFGFAAFSASDNGVLAYRGGGGLVPLTLEWVSRNGAEQPLGATPHNYTFPRISPDGKRVVAGIEESGSGQVWVYDISRDALTRLTFEGASNVDPIWTRDGKRIVFKGRENHLFWQPVDGSGASEQLTFDEQTRNELPGSWSPDGQEMAYTVAPPQFVRNIYIFPLKNRKPRLFDTGQTGAYSPWFSPDGHWIAYISNESGRNEIYVRPYPGPGGKWQISTEGGTEPVWNPKGRELFYRSGQKMMAVDYTEQPEFSARAC